MAPLYIGDHPAIDFLNTALAPGGQPIEMIGDGRAYLEWFVGAGLLSNDEAARLLRRFGGKALDAAAAEARRVREQIREWLARWRTAPQEDYSEEIEALNKLLARDARRLELLRAREGLSLVERPQIESAGALLGLLAAQIAALIAREDPALIKHCAGSACTLWFLDRSKAHRRLFCSAATCGNRAKVTAFRERQRR
jgi:predicted RNA-binding Zn ribbon-like protein